MAHESAHDKARAAGFTAKEAARWVAYLAMKERKGQQPISLDEAVQQVRAVRPA